MANEAILNATLEYDDGSNQAVNLQVVDLYANITTKVAGRMVQSVGTSEEALRLGDVAAPGWCLIINRDETNFVNVKVATAGAIFAKLKPGEFCLLRLGSGAQAPYVIADTATCKIEILIIDT